MQETPVRFLGWEDPTGEGIGYPLQYSWASLVALLVKNPPVMWRPGFDPWVGKISWRRERLPTPLFWPGEFHELYSPWDHKKSWTRLSNFHFHVHSRNKELLPFTPLVGVLSGLWLAVWRSLPAVRAFWGCPLTAYSSLLQSFLLDVMPALKSFGVPEPSVFTTVGSSLSFYGSIICFHEFEQAPGVGDGQGSLVCCSPWGCKESDTTERMNWTTIKFF